MFLLRQSIVKIFDLQTIGSVSQDTVRRTTLEYHLQISTRKTSKIKDLVNRNEQLTKTALPLLAKLNYLSMAPISICSENLR